MIRAGLFDLDGTLLDSMYVWNHVDACFFARRGLEMPSDYPRAISGMSFVDTARYTKARFDLPEDVEEIMAEWTALAREEYALRAVSYTHLPGCPSTGSSPSACRYGFWGR